MSEKILLFQLTENDRNIVKKLAANMKIKVIEVEEKDYKQTLGNLTDGKKSPLVPVYEGEKLFGSLLVFCDVTEKHMDKMLFELRAKKATITYKASKTPMNSNWNIIKMYVEMEKERKAFS